MAYTLADAQTFLGVLNAKGANFPNTPQMQFAILSWLRGENGAVTNPLGIEGSNGKFANFGSFTGAATGTANLLLGSSNYSGVVAAGRTGDPTKFLTALAQSPWDGGFSSTKGHYGTTGGTFANHLIGIYNTLAGDTRQVAPISDPHMKYGTNVQSSQPGTAGGAGAGSGTSDPFGIGAAFSGFGAQIGDTFTWLGFIIVGAILLIGGILLLKPNTIEQAGKAAAL